jgi:SAM-dependent methyltransferase
VSTDSERRLSNASVKAAITAAWDRGASGYDSNWGHGLKTEAEREAWLRLLARLLPPTSPVRILDVGCGTGFLTLLLSELGHDVVGLDLSEGMLDQARSAARDRGLTPAFCAGDAESPPDLEPFDVVISRHVLWTLLHPEQAVTAWAALVPPGGRVLAIDGLWHLTRPADRALNTAGRVMEWIQSGRSDHHGYPAETRDRLPLQRLRDLDPVRNVFRRAGLVEVMAEELAWIDDVERRVAPVAVRLKQRWRRYLIEGRRPAD